MDYLQFDYTVSGATSDQEAFNQQGTVTLRFAVDDLLPMIQRAIAETYAKNAALGLAGPYQPTSLQFTAVDPPAVAKKKAA
jgi:hypothetical protein